MLLVAACHLLAHLLQLRILHVLSEIAEFHDLQLFGMKQVLEKQKLPLCQLIQPDLTPSFKNYLRRPYWEARWIGCPFRGYPFRFLRRLCMSSEIRMEMADGDNLSGKLPVFREYR